MDARPAWGRGRIRHAWVRAARRRAADDQGMTIIEVMAALSVLTITAVGMAATVGLGFRGVALGRQRQTAIELASAKLEHARNIPYDRLARDTWPVQSPDPSNPDHFVSADGLSYDPDGSGVYEPLVVDTADGAVLGYDDPVVVGTTTMEVYQYVTWVDDPGITGTQDYKRLTVVVRYKAPAFNGTLRIARASSIFTVGDITFPTSGSTTTTAPSSSTTSPTTTTTAPANPCAGDTTAPNGSFSVSGSGAASAGYTATTSVTVTLSFTDDCSPLQAFASFSNDGITWGSEVAYDAANPTVSWSLSAGDGTKTIQGRVRDASGNYRALSPQSVILDTTQPTTPATFTRTVSCQGSDRTVNLTWSASTDTYLAGYRLYRSTDNTTWSVVSTTSALTAGNTHAKNLDSVRFRVVAYDRAGNESNATSIISLSKNQCS